ncbi:MAG: sulfur oxidation c-type cytochrome SoxA [Sinobacteraceae bacterium]|nr:sulfur oxidation c-type cytochrome SoxA [Nevskiaceae bacterium]
MKRKLTTVRSLLWALVAVTVAGSAGAQSSSPEDEIAQYRAMFGDDNPAELWQTHGEALWKQPRGPKNVALAQVCDLGLGVGVTAGAYAQLPRYFSDTGQVQDLESRLVTCMVRGQGFTEPEAIKQHFGKGDAKSDLEALSAYLVAQSDGQPMHVPFERPEERAAYELGKQVFFYRAGTHDFSCATCHSQTGKRIRLQMLPNLTTAEGAAAAYTTWPAYRISEGEFRTMEWRIEDCFRQQRLPQLKYLSPVAIALTEYLAKNADGGVIKAPGLKR